MAYEHPIVVFSHLRWDFVYQRPQHLMSRLAGGRRIIFIEEPQFVKSPVAYWNYTSPPPNVAVYRPRTPIRGGGFSDRHFPILRELLADLVQREELDPYVVWLYTPMALPLA